MLRKPRVRSTVPQKPTRSRPFGGFSLHTHDSMCTVNPTNLPTLFILFLLEESSLYPKLKRTMCVRTRMQAPLGARKSTQLISQYRSVEDWKAFPM